MNNDWDFVIPSSADSGRQIILEPGEYDFTVTNVDRKISKSQNKMFVIELQIVDKEGHKVQVTDYLTINEASLWKHAQFLMSIGLKKRGETVRSNLYSKAVGKTGRCEIYTEETTNGDRTYSANKVKTYFEKEEDINIDPDPFAESGDWNFV